MNEEVQNAIDVLERNNILSSSQVEEIRIESGMVNVEQEQEIERLKEDMKAPLIDIPEGILDSIKSLIESHNESVIARRIQAENKLKTYGIDV